MRPILLCTVLLVGCVGARGVARQGRPVDELPRTAVILSRGLLVPEIRVPFERTSHPRIESLANALPEKCPEFVKPGGHGGDCLRDSTWTSVVARHTREAEDMGLALVYIERNKISWGETIALTACGLVSPTTALYREQLKTRIVVFSESGNVMCYAGTDGWGYSFADGDAVQEQIDVLVATCVKVRER